MVIIIAIRRQSESRSERYCKHTRRKLFVTPFLLLVFYQLNIVLRHILEYLFLLALDHFEDIVRNVPLNDDLLLTLGILGDGCACCKPLGKEFGGGLEIDAYIFT